MFIPLWIIVGFVILGLIFGWRDALVIVIAGMILYMLAAPLALAASIALVTWAIWKNRKSLPDFVAVLLWLLLALVLLAGLIALVVFWDSYDEWPNYIKYGIAALGIAALAAALLDEARGKLCTKSNQKPTA